MNAPLALPLPPVVVSQHVAAAPEAAFRAFAADFGKWWPLATHSIGQAEAATAAIEPRAGGRVYERTKSGAEHLWGTVTAWEPPRRIAFTWHVGRPPSDEQVVEVTFAPEGAGCLVRLEHRGWIAGGEERRGNYAKGWTAILGERFAGHLRG
jgi:uncharacterized protein YndB with AHSA1/START domain